MNAAVTTDLSTQPATSTLYLVLLIAAVLLLIAIVIVIYILSRSRGKAGAKKEDDGKHEQPVLPASTSVTATTELATSFRGALNILHSRTHDTDYRYALPWYLLIGASGAGKSSLLAESSLAPEITEQVQVEQGASLTWNFLNDGVVLDVGGDWSFGNGANAVPTWRRLLGMLQRHRPERPLDGIVVAISARDLIGPTACEPSALVERATYLQQRLRQIQQETGLRLPVYIVITNADIIDGFREFAHALLPSERDEIFGWSNPFSTELQFRGEWTDTALAELRGGIEHRLNRIFATEEYTRSHDALSMLSTNLQGLQPRLKVLLSRALRSTTDVPEPYFRGIYLTGVLPDDAWGAQRTTAALPAGHLHPVRSAGARADFIDTGYMRTGSQSRAERNFDWGSLALTGVPEMVDKWASDPARVVYARDLFLRRIFRERTLATPLDENYRHRNRTRRTLQWTAAGLAVLFAVGLVWGYSRMSATRDRLLPLLTNVANDMTNRGYAVSDAQPQTPTDDLIRATLSNEDSGVHSVFYPASWGRPLDADVQRAVAPAFRVLVLERFERQLERRAVQVTSAEMLAAGSPSIVVRPANAADAAAAPPVADLPSYQIQKTFADSLLELQTHINQYSALSTPGSGAGLQEVVKLDAYLNSRPEVTLPDNATSPALEEALAKEPWLPFHYNPGDARAASARFQSMSTLLFTDAIENNGVKVAADALAATLRRIAGQATPAYEDLRAAQRSFNALHVALRRPDLAWVGSDTLRMPTELAAVTISPIGRTAYLPASLRPAVQEAADESFRRMSLALGSVAAPQSGPLLESTGGRMQLSSRAQETELGIENLLNLSFVAPGGGGSGSVIRGANATTEWNKAALTDALKLPASMEHYLAEDLEQAPAGLRASLGRIARDKLAAAMESAVADAATPGPRMPGNPRLDSDVQPAIARFNSVVPTLNAVLDTMRANGLSGPYQRLRAAVDQQALGLLDAVDRTFSAEDLYAVPASVLQGWNGSTDATPVLFNASSADEVAGYLAAERDRAHAYAAAADPLVQFLTADGDGGNRLVRKWSGIEAGLKGYDAKRPGNSVAQLENFITAELPKVRSAGTCVPNTPRAGSPDYFQQAATQLGGEVRVRCEALRGSGSVSAYETVAARFNADLAGRFPFADLSSSLVLEASPRTVAEFYALYDSYSALLHAGNGGAAQRVFVDELGEARPFFAALNTKAAAPSIDLVPRFRVLREREAGGNQIAEWSLEIGGQVFRSGDAEKKATWTVGQPVALNLRWAANAAFVPADVSTANMRAGAGGVRYQFTDAWALLRLMAALAVPPQDQPMTGSPNGLLMVRVPERPVRALAAVQRNSISEARVFLQLDLQQPGKAESVAAPVLPLPGVAPAAGAAPRGRASSSLYTPPEWTSTVPRNVALRREALQ